jgi:hypothetical protein
VCRGCRQEARDAQHTSSASVSEGTKPADDVFCAPARPHGVSRKTIQGDGDAQEQ